MDERIGKPEPEMDPAMSDLSYFRRQVNESLLRLHQRCTVQEVHGGGGGDQQQLRQDGGDHVTRESPNTTSGPCEVREICQSIN